MDLGNQNRIREKPWEKIESWRIIASLFLYIAACILTLAYYITDKFPLLSTILILIVLFYVIIDWIRLYHVFGSGISKDFNINGINNLDAKKQNKENIYHWIQEVLTAKRVSFLDRFLFDHLKLCRTFSLIEDSKYKFIVTIINKEGTIHIILSSSAISMKERFDTIIKT